MTANITTRYGQATFKVRQSRILTSAINEEARITGPVKDVLKPAGHLGPLLANGEDAKNGQFYGSSYDAEGHDGVIIILKHIQKFGPNVSCVSILPLRLRTTGPLVIVKGRFPYMGGFAHAEDLMLFSGRADVLELEDLRTLGVEDCLTEYDINNGFDEEDREECFEILETAQNVAGYQPRPEFVTVETEDGNQTGIALPQPHRRRVRVSAPAPTTPRKRRRRKS